MAINVGAQQERTTILAENIENGERMRDTEITIRDKEGVIKEQNRNIREMESGVVFRSLRMDSGP